MIYSPKLFTPIDPAFRVEPGFILILPRRCVDCRRVMFAAGSCACGERGFERDSV